MKWQGKQIPRILYPARCALCDRLLEKEEREVCADCGSRLPFITGQVCCSCGRPLEDEEELCRDCESRRHSYWQSLAPFPYTGRVQRSILRMKYGGRPEYASFFGHAMTLYGGELLARARPELLLPVPVHRSRYLSRGYNQAELLGSRISELTGIPMEKDLLVRCRKTVAQKNLDPRERQKNLQHAFLLRADSLPLSCVLLVDDIYTTGSTLDALSALLLEAGVGRVYGLCACIRP